MILAPAFTHPDHLVAALQRQGYAVLDPQGVCRLAGCELRDLEALRPGWNDLPPDAYLKDGGRYRRRRHSCFVARGDEVKLAPHRAHWQPVEYNALHGGMERWFEPMQPQAVSSSAWRRLIAGLAKTSSELKGEKPWYVEAHQFRIDTTDGIGRPTPEGAHRDGVDVVAVFLVGREGIKGGETRVFEAAGPAGQRFTLTEPVEDAGHRDTLVVTLRAGGFQGA
jgi:hypothetical protein